MWRDYNHFCLWNTMYQMLCKPLTFHLILKTSYEVGYCGCRWEIRGLWRWDNCFNDTTNIKNIYESGSIWLQKQDLNHHNTTIMLLLFSCQVMSDSATAWTAACQASLSLTISQSLLKFMSIELMIPCNHPILCCHLLPSILLHCRRKWQTTPVFLSWEPYELYKKAMMLYLQLIC